MTNNEAIKMLRTIKKTVFLGNQKFEDALDVAIEALEKQNAVVQVHMDLPKISEDDIKKMITKMNHQQQLEWIVDGTVPNDFAKDTNVPSTDCVSRQAAIDAVIKRDANCGIDSAKVLKTLPSAQPEPIRINLNEPIKVKLTDWGKEIYYHQYDRTNQIAGKEICKPKFPKEDENGYTEFQLWCFIELYGMHMGITLPNVIEPLEIVYER